MESQSHESSNSGNFGSPKTKCHLGVRLVAKHKVYYKGEGGGFPQVQGYGESCEFVVACESVVHPLNTKNTLAMQ
jgi:hypothetical protein